MPESDNPVRQLQTHLREAGALIASRRYDEAAAQVDAALALDPASLAALTLRDRIQKGRLAEGGAVPAAAPLPAPAEAPRFIPSGINAASWLDFEQRVQERRFRALIDSARRAIAAGDGIAARTAIEEARELRPDSIDVAHLSGRAALLPLAPPPSYDRYARSRAIRAVSMLVVGVAFLMGLDWVRSDSPEAADASIAASQLPPAPEPDVVASQLAVAPPLPRFDAAADAGVPNESEAALALATSGSEEAEPQERARRDTPVRATVTEPERSAAPLSTRVAAAPPSALPAIAPAAPVADSGASLRRDARVADAESISQTPPRGEIPDTYVAPRREVVTREAPAGRSPSISVPAPSSAPPAAAANVVRQPPSVVESLGGSRTDATSRADASPAPRPAPAATATIAPVKADDQALVELTLQQYARAFGRLDARAAKAVWPSVDEGRLARAFADLQSQAFAFEDCDISVSGPTASAACRGRATFAGKVGGTRTEPRNWKFDLVREGEDWKIASAETRR